MTSAAVLIYLDSSALVKLAVTEPGSAALIEWLGHSASAVRVSSPIVRVEVPRAVWRAGPGSLPQAYTVVRRVRDIRITASVLTRAAGEDPANTSEKTEILPTAVRRRASQK